MEKLEVRRPDPAWLRRHPAELAGIYVQLAETNASYVTAKCTASSGGMGQP
jgi:hypothetical protein